MTATEDTRTIPTLIVTFDEWLELFDLATERLDRFPYPQNRLLFSCSRSGIWPTTHHGFTQPEDRALVNGHSWVLDMIAALMIEGGTPSGGRFMVTADGAYRAHDCDPICQFELSA